MNRRTRPDATLAADSRYSLAASLVGRAATFSLAVAVARTLGPDGLGVYVLSVVVGTLVFVAADGGLIPAALAFAQGDPASAAEVRRRLTPLRFLYLFLSLAIGLAASFMLVEGVGENRPATSLIVLGFGLQSLSRFARFPLLAAGQLRREVTLTMFERIATAAVAIAALAVTKSLLSVAVVHAAVPLITGIYAALRLRFPREQRAKRPLRSVVLAGLRLGAITLVSQTYGRVDTIILAAFVSAVSLGTYGAAYTLVSSALIVPAALYNMALANSFGEHGGRAERFYLRNLRWTSVVFGFLVAVLGPVATSLLFSLSYDRQLQVIFLFLGPAFFFMAQNSSLNLMAVKYGTSSWLLKVTGIALGANVFSCLLLIPLVGISGAAASTCATEILIYLVAKRARVTPTNLKATHV